MNFLEKEKNIGKRKNIRKRKKYWKKKKTLEKEKLPIKIKFLETFSDQTFPKKFGWKMFPKLCL